MAIRHNLNDDDRTVLRALNRAVFKSELTYRHMADELETDEQYKRFIELLGLMEKAEAIVVPEKKQGG